MPNMITSIQSSSIISGAGARRTGPLQAIELADQTVSVLVIGCKETVTQS
jgi:AMMECR1 domain-containing protein